MAAPLRALLQPGTTTAAGLRPEIPARIEWWPVLLRGSLDAERIKSAGLDALSVDRQPHGDDRELETGKGVLLEFALNESHLARLPTEASERRERYSGEGWCRGLESNQ